jgi:enamine deaminase RidA (YjgF/YER057c/UK114 family)
VNADLRARFDELGIELPPAPSPRWNYLPWVRTGNLIYTAGQTPKVAGELAYAGRCGAGIDVATAQAAARLCAINTLAVLEDAVGLENVTRIVKVNGYVASADGFVQQAEVINGASDVFTAVLGAVGAHSRTAVGAPWLPNDATVEIETIVEISD